MSVSYYNNGLWSEEIEQFLDIGILYTSLKASKKNDAIKQYWTGVDRYFIFPTFWFSELRS